MPSPFPGMDPYLEGPEWTSVHAELSSEIARQLSPKLRPKYIVRLAKRFVTEMPDDIGIMAMAGDIYPDVSVGESDFSGIVTESPAHATSAPLQIATVMPARVPHLTVKIHDVAHRELVTAIEVLSPANKRGDGYREYLEKRRKILNSSAHLLEIDLLRIGRRVPMQEPLPKAPYFIFLSRSERRPITEIWPIYLQMRLPTLPIPLLPSDPDISLDLQKALDTVYDVMGYDLSIDYTRPPAVPLDDKAYKWARAQLKKTGTLKESTDPA